MSMFSYVVKHDSGFAPNPFGGLLTLATCKPRIRITAGRDDFLVGTGSAATVGNKMLVYAGQIACSLPLDEYGDSPRYDFKRPSAAGEWWRQHGDNIYYKVKGQWKQRQSRHHTQEHMVKDLSGENVLICERFWYFGSSAIDIPEDLRDIIKKGPGHKRINDELLAMRFIRWLETLPLGCHGEPEMSSGERIRVGCSRRPLCEDDMGPADC